VARRHRDDNWIKGWADVQPHDSQPEADQSKPNQAVPSPQTHAPSLRTALRPAIRPAGAKQKEAFDALQQP
jgi:hypothetical protein